MNERSKRMLGRVATVAVGATSLVAMASPAWAANDGCTWQQAGRTTYFQCTASRLVRVNLTQDCNHAYFFFLNYTLVHRTDFGPGYLTTSITCNFMYNTVNPGYTMRNR